MMLSLAFLFLAQSVPEPPVAADEAEIVVTARKLSNRWRGRVETVVGQTTCQTIKSTGDAEFDAIGCKAMLVCWPDFLPQIEAAGKAEVAAGRIKTREDMDRALLRAPLHNIYQKFAKCARSRLWADIRVEIKRRRAEARG